MILQIKGKVHFEDIEGGLWGIVGNDGKKWLPIPFPEQLKLPGASVNLRVKEATDIVTLSMWGTPVRIISFHTLKQG